MKKSLFLGIAILVCGVAALVADTTFSWSNSNQSGTLTYTGLGLASPVISGTVSDTSAGTHSGAQTFADDLIVVGGGVTQQWDNAAGLIDTAAIEDGALDVAVVTCDSVASAGAISISSADQGTANPALSIGSLATPLSFALTDSTIPIQCSVVSTADPASQKTLTPAYFKSANSTVAQPHTQLCGPLARVSIANDIDSAYGVQSHVGIVSNIGTRVSLANITAISGKIDLDANVTTGQVSAIYGTIEGSGTVTEAAYNLLLDICGSASIDAMALIQASGGSDADYGIYFTGDVGEEIRGQNGETFDNSVNGFWTVGGGIALTNSNSITMDGTACLTTNQTFLSATGVTNTMVIVDGLITEIN